MSNHTTKVQFLESQRKENFISNKLAGWKIVDLHPQSGHLVCVITEIVFIEKAENVI